MARDIKYKYINNNAQDESMIYKKVILLLLLTALAVFSQQITISGKVTDTTGVAPITGAVVKLEKYGFADTTTADGSFVLTGLVSSIDQSIHQLQPNALSANMRNGMLSLYVPERGAVSITTYTIQGKAVSKIEKVLDKGAHSIAQPDLGKGVYIYKIRAGSRELMLKNSSLVRTGSAIALSAPTPVTASSASRYVPIDDVIFASKEGLLNYRVMVTNSDTSGIVIKMIPNAGNVTDADGNVYQSVRIGIQVWTVENWRSTKYNDGTAIPHVTDGAAWKALTTPGYCYFNNATQTDTIKKWGALYNWYVLSYKQIAPAGWRVPTDAEWDTLQNYLIANGYNWDGTMTGNKIAKSMAAKSYWEETLYAGMIGNDQSKNNTSGFSALPGGDRSDEGNFFNQSDYGSWWSATEYGASHACSRFLNYILEDLKRSVDRKSCGFSVRLLRDFIADGKYLLKAKSMTPWFGRVTPAYQLVDSVTGRATVVFKPTGWSKIDSLYVGTTKISTIGPDDTAYTITGMTKSDSVRVWFGAKPVVYCDSVYDAEGNVYHAIRIGNQVWTVENWRSTKYNDGTAIPYVSNDTAWAWLLTPAYCYYKNATHADTIMKWGALYNWYVFAPTNSKKIAPAGWHVPTDAEWDTLQIYLIANGYNWDGTTMSNKIAKAMATKSDWSASTTAGASGNDLTKNNASGFSALPGGDRSYLGFFYGQSGCGSWWSASETDASYAYFRDLGSDCEYLGRNLISKSCGFSVRLLRD